MRTRKRIPVFVFGAYRTLIAAALTQHARRGAVQQPELRVRPDGLDGLRVRDADAGVPAERRPVRGALDVELGEDRVDGAREARDLLDVVAGGDGEPEALFAPRDGRIVDRLHVDVVLLEEHVGSTTRKGGIADEDGDDVRGAGNDRNIHSLEARLEVADVQLLELTVTVVLLLVRDTRTGAGHVRRGEGRRKDEAGSV